MRISARIVRIDLIVIGALTIGVTTLIVDFTVNRTTGIIALVAALVLVAALWVVLPSVMRGRALVCGAAAE